MAVKHNLSPTFCEIVILLNGILIILLQFVLGHRFSNFFENVM